MLFTSASQRARSRFLKHRAGAGLGEYALIAALIAGVSALAVASLGIQSRDVLANISDVTQEAGGGAGSGPGTGGGGSGGSEPTAPQSGVPGENFALTLGGASLPQANRLSPWTFDFSSLIAFQDPGTVSLADLAWSGGDPLLPSWMNLDPQTGVASGTPDVTGEATFEVVASYMGADGRQVYVLNVGGAIIEVVQIAAGTIHTCAVTTSGAAMCWGHNGYGQLGDGATTVRHIPVVVSGLAGGVASISAGSAHTCAVTTSGAAMCWGWNNSGRLGDGTTTDRHTPVVVSGLASGVASISAGDRHTCAVTAAGAVMCWGFNFYGQIGDGTTTTRLAPREVSSLASGVTSVAVGYNHTCAVTAAQAAMCWGRNDFGHIGDGSTTTRLAPVSVSGLASGVASITAGGEHTCAVTTSGAAMCWGHNGYGQLGDGATTHRLIPVSVSGLASGVASISGGGQHTCAITAAGAAMCWGRNNYGQLGDGATTTRLTPLSVSGPSSGLMSISAGGYHTCAIPTSGSAMCWGRSDFGQVGDGATTTRLTPVDLVF